MKLTAPRTGATAAVLLAAASPALANDIQIELVSAFGDEIPGVGFITSYSDVTVNSDGSWAVIANTDNPSLFDNSVVLRDGSILFVEGQTLTDPQGFFLKGLGPIYLDDAGRLTATFTTVPSGGFDVEVVLVDGKVVKETGVPAPPGTAPPAGFPIVSFVEARTNAAGQLLTHVTVDDGSNFRSAMLLSQLDAQNEVIADAYIAWETLLLPSGTGAPAAVENLVGGPNQHTLSETGVVGFLADLNAPGFLEIGFYLNGAPVAVEGLASPVPGRNWADLAFAPIDVNASGESVVVGRVSGDSNTDLIVARGTEVVAQEGDPVPGVPGQTILNFNQTSPIFIDANGEVLWQAVWLEGGLRKGLFLDDEPLVLEGVTQVGGATIVDFFGFQDGYELSPDGSKLLFRASLDDGTEGVFLLSIEPEIESLPGCLGNLAGLTIDGDASPGGNLQITLDGATQVPAAATVWIAGAPAIPGSPCGLPLGAAGEVLIGLTPAPLVLDLGLFAGSAVSTSVDLAPNPALIGQEVWTQGLFIAPGHGQRARADQRRAPLLRRLTHRPLPSERAAGADSGDRSPRLAKTFAGVPRRFWPAFSLDNESRTSPAFTAPYAATCPELGPRSGP